MATNLTDIIKKVRTALRGEEVRGSIADGLEFCGQISENAKADMEATAASTKEQLSKDIDAKAAETLKTIPESYTELDGSMKQLKEDLDNWCFNPFNNDDYELGDKDNYTNGISEFPIFMYNDNGNIVVISPNEAFEYKAISYSNTDQQTTLYIFKYNDSLTFDVLESFDFKNGETHRYKNTSGYPICVGFLQKSKNKIRTTTNPQNTPGQTSIQSYIADNDLKTIRFYIAIKQLRYFSFIIKVFRYTDKSLSMNDIPADSKTVGKVLCENGIGKSYVVDKNGNGDYISLYECLNAFKDISDYKIIHINEGVYDLYEEMGGDNYFSAIDTNAQTIYDVQPWLTNVKIIGHGNVEINLNIPITIPQKIRWLFSNLNVKGNCWIENIELNSNNNRYAIHDENGNEYPNTTHVYKNLRMNKKMYSVCLGCGFSKGSTLVIEDCKLNSQYGGAYSHHSKGGLNLTIKNSIFTTETNSNSVRFSTESNEIDIINIDNSFIGTGLMLRPEFSFSNSICNTIMDIKNTKIVELLTEEDGLHYDSFNGKIKFYNTIEGTIVDLTPSN
jgi:hypothetical protein